MKSPKRNKRLLYLLFMGVSLFVGGYLILSALGQNVSYFYSPIQIANGEADDEQRLRLGGLVAAGTVERGSGTITSFEVTDGAANVVVSYTGILPDLFREGQGVIAQGEFNENQVFIADTILAKHDENYKPKELVDALDAAEEYKSQLKQPIAYTGGSTHVSKKFIAENCSVATLNVDMPITGAAFASYGQSPKISYLALGHGKNGASLYDGKGNRIWHNPQRTDMLSSFGDTILIYRKEANTSILERFKVGIDGQVSSLSVESPSEIAPTTLQRSSYSSLGPASFKNNGLLLEKSFIKLRSRPTAIAATNSVFGTSLKEGTVAIGLSNGTVQIWGKRSVFEGCS